MISALGAENGVQPVNERGHISHQSPPHSRVSQGLNLTYTASSGYDGNQQDTDGLNNAPAGSSEGEAAGPDYLKADRAGFETWGDERGR